MSIDMEPRMCSLCGEPFVGYGHNPEPLAPFEDRCCDRCNANRVIPTRLARIQLGQDPREDQA